MIRERKPIHIVGAGLAGSECAFQLAEKGHQIILHEMRDQISTPAHKTGNFAELVCSNSFGSLTDYSAPGQLKWEAEKLGSIILSTAHQCAVPAGMALGVDRELFAQTVTHRIEKHPNIRIHRELISNFDNLPRPTVIATGPLTHAPLAQNLASHFGHQFLYFFDAMAPIIDKESINFDIAWFGDRWGKGQGDYINCPLNKEQYFHLINEIEMARKIEPKEFEKTPYFEACMPIEAIVERGPETLRFGPLSPKGLSDPRSEKRPYAVVQLRQDNLAGTAYNMVGFQTKMAYPEQKRIFRMIPGLEAAEFLKLGSMHRNLYINTPQSLTPILSSRKDRELYFAGQITGVEGYFESTCIGLLVALFIDQSLSGLEPCPPPRATALGSLLNAITETKENFQPTNINFGLMPNPPESQLKLPRKLRREEKRSLQIAESQRNFLAWFKHNKFNSNVTESAQEEAIPPLLISQDCEVDQHRDEGLRPHDRQGAGEG